MLLTQLHSCSTRTSIAAYVQGGADGINVAYFSKMLLEKDLFPVKSPLDYFMVWLTDAKGLLLFM